MIGFGLHGRHWASSHLNMVNPSEPGRSRFRVSLADVGPFHAPGIAGSVHWRQHEEKKHQPNEMCKKQTSPFRCAFRTHTGASWANDHELSIIIYLLVGFHGGSLLLIHPVLYRTSSGYGVPTQWCPNRKASHWAPHPARPLRGGDVVQISDRLIQVLRWSRLFFCMYPLVICSIAMV